jgi:hypothetical protein
LALPVRQGQQVLVEQVLPEPPARLGQLAPALALNQYSY